MAKQRPLFDGFPTQFEWALVALLAYSVHLLVSLPFPDCFLPAVSFLIILNGWISSRAAKSFYSDAMFVSDCFILALYYVMLDSVRDSANESMPRFCLVSCLVLTAYIVWDIAILSHVGDAKRRRRYHVYIALMSAIILLHGGLAWFTWTYPQNYHEAVIACLALSWIYLLWVWHYDKWRASHVGTEGENNAAAE